MMGGGMGMWGCEGMGDGRDGCDDDDGYDDDYAGGRGDLGEAQMRLTTGTAGEKCVCVE